MLYPVTMASFQKFKLNKKKYRTHAEIYESSWVFNQLKNPFGKIDIYKSLHDHVLYFNLLFDTLKIFTGLKNYFYQIFII